MTNYHTQLSVGDVLTVPKAGFKHVGIVVLGGVLHNSPGKGERLESLADFANGKTFTIERSNADSEIVTQRAYAILRAPRPYDVLFQNCEHTVSEILTGAKQSPQLGSVVVVGALVFLFTKLFGPSGARAA